MIKIITDSTSDITKEYAQANNVTVVPLNVNFGSESYKDGIDMTAEEFYKRLADSEKLPTTSQPSPEEFMVHFEKAKQNGEEVVGIFISESLSGTCQSAQIAKDELDYDGIYIVDSKTVTIAAGLLVKRAVELAKTGISAKELAQDLENAREHLHIFAIIDNLTNLRKGGRLSGAAALAGGLLGIKPVVGINREMRTEEGHNGKLEIASKARGLPGAYVAVFKLIEKVGGINEDLPVEVGYAGDKDGVQPFVRYVEQNLHLNKPQLGAIGAVVGTHSGAGACGIAFFDKGLDK